MNITGLTPDPLTGLQRILLFKGFSVDQVGSCLTIFWRLSVLRLDGSESAESRDLQQVAQNSTLINMETFAATGQIVFITEDQLIETIPPPQTMGEYDFWWFVSDNYPQPIRTQILDAGQKFAIRNGWLT